jgi:hypothetical protein
MPTVPNWKRFETRIAKALGGKRIPVTGIDRADRDVETPMFFVQAKRRKSLPSWLGGWLIDICQTARPKGKIGVLILGRPGQRDRDAIVCLRLSDFIALHGANGGAAVLTTSDYGRTCHKCGHAHYFESDVAGFDSAETIPWGHCTVCDCASPTYEGA